LTHRKPATLSPPVGDRDHRVGPDDARVTLVEYGDFECPHCGQAYPIVEEVRRRLGKQLRFVFRHFPLNQMHPHAEHAAEVAEAADAQGMFWPMHHMLFERQAVLDDNHLVEYARELGLDAARLQAELHSGTYRTRVRDDFLSGVRSGVNGTPTFFINGVRLDGGYGLEELLDALEQARPVPSRTELRDQVRAAAAADTSPDRAASSMQRHHPARRP
jgi:protein-disulfide isomerase